MTYTLHLGDCLDILPTLAAGSADAVITDPPYPKEYAYTYGYLADLCPRVMKDGASLFTLLGHYAIPEVLEKFEGKLKYRWLICMNQFEGKHPRMAMGIEVMWKPVLWYVKGAYPQGRGFVRDGFVVSGDGGQDKTRHKWEQDISWALFFVEKFTNPGDTILDPFMGSGTTGVACMQTGRNFIGIELDPDYYAIAERRISEAAQQLTLAEAQ